MSTDNNPDTPYRSKRDPRLDTLTPAHHCRFCGESPCACPHGVRIARGEVAPDNKEPDTCVACDNTGYRSAGDPTNPLSMCPCECERGERLQVTKEPDMSSPSGIGSAEPHITAFACWYCRDTGLAAQPTKENPLGVDCNHCGGRFPEESCPDTGLEPATDVGSHDDPWITELLQSVHDSDWPRARDWLLLLSEHKSGGPLECLHGGDTGPGMSGLRPSPPPASKARITGEDIEYAITFAKRVYYHRIPHTTTTICAVTLSNDFVVVGTSAAVSPENFDYQIGRDVALDKVRDKLWPLLGFRLKQALYDGGAS